MRKLAIMAVGFAAVWYITETRQPEEGLFIFGCAMVAFVAWVETDLKQLQKAVQIHAKKLFPSRFDEEE